MTPTDIKRLRADLQENAATFGARFHRSGRTVEDWEQGRRNPDPLAIAMLVDLRLRTGRNETARKRGRPPSPNPVRKRKTR